MKNKFVHDISPDKFSKDLFNELLPQPSHSNYTLWLQYHTSALFRGVFAADSLAQHMKLAHTHILDIGCGIGGTSLALARRGAFIVAIDKNKKYINAFASISKAMGERVYTAAGDGLNLHFSQESFDAVILQDTLEHVGNPLILLEEIARVLKPGGLVYMTTPNRLSVFNIVSDPHWQLPIIALLPRRSVYTITRFLGRTHRGKTDCAALLSLFKLNNLCVKAGFQLTFKNSFAAYALFDEPRKVVCSTLHTKIVTLLLRLRLHNNVIKIVNDKFGFFNYFINPTWYIIAKKT